MHWFRCGLLVGSLSLAVGPSPGQEKAPSAWTVWIPKEARSSRPPILVQDWIIATNSGGTVRALSREDGKELWVHTTKDSNNHEACSDGRRVFVVSRAGLAALKLSDGEQVWAIGGEKWHGPTAVDAKRRHLYVGRPDGQLCALDALNGNVLWGSDYLNDAPPDPKGFDGARARFDDTRARPTDVVSDGETVYLTVMDQCRVVAVNAADGKRLWSFQTNGWVGGPVAFGGKNVYIGSQDGSLYALDRVTGKKAWSYAGKGRADRYVAAAGGVVYFGTSRGLVYCLDEAEGKLQWLYEADANPEVTRDKGIWSEPAVAAGRLYFGSGDGQLCCLDAKTGKLRWSEPLPGRQLAARILIDGKRLYASTYPDHRIEGPSSVIAMDLKE